MEAICFSEASIETQRTTRRHIPEDYALNVGLLLTREKHSFRNQTAVRYKLNEIERLSEQVYVKNNEYKEKKY
jgi:hypothetical protein